MKQAKKMSILFFFRRDHVMCKYSSESKRVVNVLIKYNNAIISKKFNLS